MKFELETYNRNTPDKESLVLATEIACTVSLNVLKSIQEGIQEKYGEDSIIKFRYKNIDFKLRGKNNTNKIN